MGNYILHWIVRVYNSENEVIHSWEIHDRFEWEAYKEAESDVAKIHECVDWSLNPLTLNAEEV